MAKEYDAELNREYAALNAEQKRRVEAVIAEVKRTGQREGLTVDGAEYYAYPHASGGTAWGIDNPLNIARGVKP